MPSLALKPFLMQFSKWILASNKKIKRMLEKHFLEYIYYIRRLFLSYHLTGKSLASTENKNQKHKNTKL